MPTNFDFLKIDTQFVPFAEAMVQAELGFSVSPVFCAINCRIALESAIKWLYSIDESLKKPYDTCLTALVGSDGFQDFLPPELFPKVKYIMKISNVATQNPENVTADQAVLALDNLHSFATFINYCYSKESDRAPAFDKPLLNLEHSREINKEIVQESKYDFDTLLDRNAPVRRKYTERRIKRLKDGYPVKPIEFTEFETRKVYIDTMLEDVGWLRNVNWFDEYPIDEMPNKSNEGFADYVLFGDDGLPLAVIEAKRTSVNVERGRQQAVLYADFLEKKFKQRPIIFLSNGYDTRIWNDHNNYHYPERPVSSIYSKRDLQKEFNKMKDRKSLKGVRIKDSITDRYYQKEAIQAVCDTFGERNRRKALLVMATGSGKTRVSISIVDVLERYGWIKNVLFLADRTALIKQAKGKFNILMPNLSLCELTENKEDASARIVFSTYQTMINCIDDTRDEKGDRLFTPGHFDLIIVDEAHRSIYNKYKDIFTYFDALVVGLTATPKDDLDKNTYDIFDLEVGVPTYGYDLAQGVQDEFLVDYETIVTTLEFLSQGIEYDKLSPEEKEQYEETFADESGIFPPSIENTALNNWLFNHDTIAEALNILMERGLKVDSGTKIGKTIIFAKSHLHALEIEKVWNKEYPNYPPHYCRVIDNYINYAQDLIDDFSDRDKFPQIAISVDMLDTGIDVLEILNLMFFKKVFSKSKFHQMIGRGTRTCEGLIDGKDKEKFYIFDLCGNFSFFKVNSKGHEAAMTPTLQERIFNTKIEMIYILQNLNYQIDYFISYRAKLVNELLSEIEKLNRNNYAVKQHLKIIDRYQSETDLLALTYANTQEIAEHIAPLILPPEDDSSAVRFDMLIYQIELGILASRSFNKAKKDVIKKTRDLSRYASIPSIATQKELIEQILHNDYLDRAGIEDYEDIRIKLRDLLKFIPPEERNRYFTNFTDTVLSIEHNESDLDNDDLAQYKKKVNYYIRQHQDSPAIAKLKSNVPLTANDVKELERILWTELGTKEQYDAQYKKTPLGELVRSIVGLSIEAANKAFSAFLNNVQLDSIQMNFVKHVIKYIVKHGMMTDLSILQESPFSDMGNISEIFEDVKMFTELRNVIESINSNAATA